MEVLEELKSATSLDLLEYISWKDEYLEEAIKILNDMPLVKNKVAKFTLNSVGILWLKQF